ncbi:MAG: hypothetical protein LLF28_07300 [Nitrospiraceae bacterium]|nr:hypothetical protein [Nitrospiraceae bacterium]
MDDKRQYIPGYAQRKEEQFESANKLFIGTIIFNLARGLLSLSFGFITSSLTLIGFGVEAFIEMIYSAVIWNMVQRSTDSYIEPLDSEKQALKTAGVIYYIIAVVLAIIGIVNIFRGHIVDKSLGGIGIAVFSALLIYVLSDGKIKIAKKLNSAFIFDDAEFMNITMYLAGILFISSLCHLLTGINIFDSVGTILIGFVIFIKGKNIFKTFKI